MITDSRIDLLASESRRAGDLRMAVICALALGDTDALLPCDSGTEADRLLREGRTQGWARTQCERVVRDTAAETLTSALDACDYSDDDSGPAATAAWRAVRSAVRDAVSAGASVEAHAILARAGFDLDIMIGE